MKEDLQAPTFTCNDGEALDAMWRLDMGDPLRQQEWRPHFGANSGACHLSGWICGITVERQARLCGKHHPDVFDAAA